jgi:hypothetical protein
VIDPRVEEFVQIGSHCSIYSVSTIDGKSGAIALKKVCRGRQPQRRDAVGDGRRECGGGGVQLRECGYSG